MKLMCLCRSHSYSSLGSIPRRRKRHCQASQRMATIDSTRIVCCERRKSSHISRNVSNPRRQKIKRKIQIDCALTSTSSCTAKVKLSRLPCLWPRYEVICGEVEAMSASTTKQMGRNRFCMHRCRCRPGKAHQARRRRQIRSRQRELKCRPLRWWRTELMALRVGLEYSLLDPRLST